jgi:hypothetical protein
MVRPIYFLTQLALLGFVGCSPNAEPDPPDERVNCLHADTEGATASCVVANRAPEYYIQEAEAYFDTLDLDASRESVPDYHPMVARWEWPPWLLLTGLTADDMIKTSRTLRSIDPSTVPARDCRFFEEQPFARCYVEFEYEGGSCPIYEEFSFDREGRMNFIEAWSNLPGLLPNASDDPWAEAENYPRLATRIPGLGNETGTFDLESQFMAEASAADADVADFALRASQWEKYWAMALIDAPENFFGIGCGWVESSE